MPSYHVRYIEEHNLGFPQPVYVISILENFSCMLLASIISERQDTEAYLKVLSLALRNYGAPECIVTDGGGIFYAHRAMAIYEALGVNPNIKRLMATSDTGGEVEGSISSRLLHDSLKGRGSGLFWCFSP